jgi:hypothetical protein
VGCVTAIPIYKSSLTQSEVNSLLRAKTCIGENVFLVGPKGLDTSLYKYYWPSVNIVYFPEIHFSSIRLYSEFMLSRSFYQTFSSEYSWILIYQLDAFIIKNEIRKFCSYNYDYFGAPWTKKQFLSPTIKNPYLKKYLGKSVQVGNGGFSLRRIKSTITFLEKYDSCVPLWDNNEDGFFAYYGKGDADYRIAPFELAKEFAFEQDPTMLHQLNGFKLPMGCHGFDKYSPSFYELLIKCHKNKTPFVYSEE